MIVFYLKESGQCMLALDCAESEITIADNKAYYRGEVVNNNMEISAYVVVPAQAIGSIGPDGMPVHKLVSELTTGAVPPTDPERLAALEDAIIALMGV